MPNLQDVINELRRLGVLPTEVTVTLKIVAKLLEEAEDLKEQEQNPVEG